MRTLLATGVMLAVLLILAPAALAQEAALTFNATTHDFGAIQQGTQARHTFIFHNTSDVSLQLTSVTPSCGCTTPHWTHASVAPGDTGHVAAVFDSEGRAGSFEKTIRVETDRTETSSTGAPVTLTIRGRVQLPPIEGGIRAGHLLLARQAVDLGTIPEGERGRRTVRIQNVGERPIRFTDVDTPSNMVSGYVPRAPLFVGDMDEITVLVRAYAMTAGDSFSYPITLITDDEAQPEKVIRVTGNVVE